MTKKLLRLLPIIMAFSCCLNTGCASPKEAEVTVVPATVTNKEYTESYDDFGYYFDSSKGHHCWKLQTIPAKYDVKLQYGELETTYDSKKLYDAVEVGDTVEVELLTYSDSREKIQRPDISTIQ